MEAVEQRKAGGHRGSDGCRRQAAVDNQRKNPSSRSFVYRDLLKARSFFKKTRETLADPAYSGWFLHFDPTLKSQYHTADCDHNFEPPKCSRYYHDQTNTPQRHAHRPQGPPSVVVGTHASSHATVGCCLVANVSNSTSSETFAPAFAYSATVCHRGLLRRLTLNVYLTRACAG